MLTVATVQDFVKRAETAETVAENEQNERQKTRAQLEETQAERNRAQADAERLQVSFAAACCGLCCLPGHRW